MFFSFRLCSRGLQNLRRNDAEDGDDDDDDADLEHSFPGLGRPMFASLATNAGSPTRPLYDEAAFQRYARSLVVVEFHRYPVACANRLGPSCDSPGIDDTDDCPERSFVKSLCPAGHPGRATEQTVPRERESDCRKGFLLPRSQETSRIKYSSAGSLKSRTPLKFHLKNPPNPVECFVSLCHYRFGFK